MTIPSQTEMYEIVLNLYGEGDALSRKDVREHVPSVLKLSEDEMRETTSSGAPIYRARAEWAISTLFDLGLLERKSEGIYQISPEGKSQLQQGIRTENIRLMVNKLNRERKRTKQKQSAQAEENVMPLPQNQHQEDFATQNLIDAEQGLSPLEVLEQAKDQLEETLQRDLLEALLDLGPRAFEFVVLDLLAAMGYGNPTTTSYSNDGGIDGIITTDSLGFDPIYTQAKRYALDHKVGRPEVQAFAGALGKVSRGAFITTSTFSDGAKEFARNYPHATISLINGKSLTSLMIKYDIGVSIERTIKIKRFDTDYFEDKG